MSDKPCLGPIAGATVLAPDFDATIAAYDRYLGYRAIATGRIEVEAAGAWGTPAMTGRRFAVTRPASGDATWIRFVEGPRVPGYKAMTTHGWHSMEIVITDVEATPGHLQGSPFVHIGGPKEVGTSGFIRAAQFEGPCNEVLYLTRILKDPSRPYLPTAKSFIDRIFIMVLGSRSMTAARDFYTTHFDTKPNVDRPAVIGFFNRANDLPEDTPMQICTVVLDGQCLIEIDNYPSVARERPRDPGALPPGVGMVSFAVDSLAKVKLPFIAPPRPIHGAPYDGRRVGTCLGSSGEYIELIES
ncbi:MAG: hypothetical protein FJX65_08235 [Alphaproteobacteria bacterium]|nr:hypothetical protein [Alphaproteobacteria bacterium]